MPTPSAPLTGDPLPEQDELPAYGTASFKTAAHQRYEELRERGPIHRVRLPNGLPCWLVVSYELAREAFTHPALGKDPAPGRAALESVGDVTYSAGRGLAGNMLTADPPQHTRLRKLVAGAFTPRRVQALAPGIQALTDELLDRIAPLGAVDLVREFTAPLPMGVISELLGVPEEHREDFREWSQQALGNPRELQRSGLLNLNHYLAQLLRDKRGEPGDDLLSALVAVHDEHDGRLTDEELLGTAVLLVVAGHDTTVGLLSNAVLALLCHPEQAELLRRRPDLVPGAVEEVLRFDAPVETTPARFATEDLELGGVTVRRGELVQIALTSVGRDGGPGAGTLDITRPDGRHLSFGHGIHHCLGAPLARLEAEIALTTLLRRLPDLELAVPADEVVWIPSGLTRGPTALPVRFRPRPHGG